MHVTVREDIARSFSEAEAEREERAAGWAARFSDRADRAAGASKAALVEARPRDGPQGLAEFGPVPAGHDGDDDGLLPLKINYDHYQQSVNQ
ncbi:hypothetical protein [Streptomyces sp. NPDC007369]|uniref:hypothetical protein n=1 Tax=Streptomyces sp. NPDC007369 TaxID=3154589 RepID=UPI0033D28C6C